MEELAFLGLLECPLCFKQLDGSAKILPCQHTFCKACLQKQAASASPLFCPECLTPTLARTVDDLPAHFLQVRLVGGPPDPMGPDRSGHPLRYMVPMSRENPGVRESQQEPGENRSKEQQKHKEVRGTMHAAVLDPDWSSDMGHIAERDLCRKNKYRLLITLVVDLCHADTFEVF